MKTSRFLEEACLQYVKIQINFFVCLFGNIVGNVTTINIGIKYIETHKKMLFFYESPTFSLTSIVYLYIGLFKVIIK